MLSSQMKREKTKGKQRVALNALLGHSKDEYREIACQQVGLAYRRVRAGKAHPGNPVRMNRFDLAPDSEFLPTWEVVDPNALGKQVIGYERGVFGEGTRLTQTRANGSPLAGLR